jgi:hypothetical protein
VSVLHALPLAGGAESGGAAVALFFAFCAGIWFAAGVVFVVRIVRAYRARVAFIPKIGRDDDA